jgi:hypothetical protein
MIQIMQIPAHSVFSMPAPIQSAPSRILRTDDWRSGSSGAYLHDREIAKLELTEVLQFIDLAVDGGLASIGADNRLTTGSYQVVQLWSAALRKHPLSSCGYSVLCSFRVGSAYKSLILRTCAGFVWRVNKIYLFCLQLFMM